MKVAYEEGCSLAIFAPAWTHEAMSAASADPNYTALADALDAGQQFRLRDRALWGSFWPFLNTRLPCSLPFKTSFCQGYGKKYRVFGEVCGAGTSTVCCRVLCGVDESPSYLLYQQAATKNVYFHI